MSNPRKAKGTRWETAVYRWLQDRGVFVYRPRQEGFRDVGDLHAPPVVLQAKDWKDVASALREGVEGARVQARHAGFPFGFAVVKRARKPVEEAYVVLRLGDLPPLLRALTDAEADSSAD